MMDEEKQDKIPETPETETSNTSIETPKEAPPDIKVNEVPIPETITPEYVASLEDRLSKFEEANGKLLDLVESTPELFEVIRLMMGGKKFRPAMMSVISTDDLTPKEGDEDYPDAMAAMTDRQNFLKGKREREESVMKNIEESAKAIEEFKQANGLSDDEVKAFLESVDADVSDMIDGKMTMKMLSNLWKASRYESDIETAAKQGKIEGRNENIEVVKQTKKDDGLPTLSSSSDLPPKPTRPKTKADLWAEQENRKRII